LFDKGLRCFFVEEFGAGLGSRSFANTYDDVAGTFTATDQDGNTFTTTTDAAGRVNRVSRTISRAGGMVTIMAVYTYDAAGKLKRVDNGSGTAVIRDYDAADRPTLIRH